MSSNAYELIDEPSGNLSHLALAPIALLLITMFIPKPYQFFMPIVFLINAYMLGCFDLKKQIMIVLFGSIFIFVVLSTLVALVEMGVFPISQATAQPYIRILTNAGLFALLYKLFILQNPTHELTAYIRQQRVD